LNARLYCRLYLFNNCRMNTLCVERCSFIHVDGLLLFAMYVSIYFIGYLFHKEREIIRGRLRVKQTNLIEDELKNMIGVSMERR
jgi:hypothetical protein